MCSPIKLLFLVVGTLLVAPLCADEIILEEHADQKIVGDFNCTSGFLQPTNSIQLLPGKDSLTAGELWAHFDALGIESIDTLVICLDVEPSKSDNNLDLDLVEFTIKDPFDESTLTSFSLDSDGDHKLILPSYEASAFKSEAQMQIKLGFDFMKKYTKDSTEKVVLNVEMDGDEAAQPSFFISPENSGFNGVNALTLIIFTLFCVVVFAVLYRATSPQVSEQPAASKQAASV